MLIEYIISFIRTHTENVSVCFYNDNCVIVDAFSMSRYFVKCLNFYINHTIGVLGRVIGLQLDDFKFKLQVVQSYK